MQTFGPRQRRDWQAHDLDAGGSVDALPRAARRVTVRRRSRCRCSARTTCATRSRRSPWRPKSGSSADRIAEGLRLFAGVKRRLEIVGIADGVTVYDDFAHHPTAVAETLAGLRAVESVGADLGGVRAAFRLVVPSRVSGRFRPGVCAAPTRC